MKIQIENGCEVRRTENNGVNVDLLLDDLSGFIPKLNFIKDKSTFLVVGNTGAGKSTLVNCLIGRELVEVDLPSGPAVDVKSPEEDHAPIGAGDSKTIWAQPYVDLETQLCFCDCPGFKDTRLIDTRIKTGLSFRLAATLANEIRGILVVIKFSEIDATRGGPLKDLMVILGNILILMSGYDWSQSLTFVVTDVPSGILLHHIQYRIKGFAERAERSLAELQASSVGRVSEESTELTSQLIMFKLMQACQERICIVNRSDLIAGAALVTRASMHTLLMRSTPIPKEHLMFTEHDGLNPAICEFADVMAMEKSLAVSDLLNLTRKIPIKENEKLDLESDIELLSREQGQRELEQRMANNQRQLTQKKKTHSELDIKVKKLEAELTSIDTDLLLICYNKKIDSGGFKDVTANAVAFGVPTLMYVGFVCGVLTINPLLVWASLLTIPAAISTYSHTLDVSFIYNGELGKPYKSVHEICEFPLKNKEIDPIRGIYRSHCDLPLIVEGDTYRRLKEVKVFIDIEKRFYGSNPQRIAELRRILGIDSTGAVSVTGKKHELATLERDIRVLEDEKLRINADLQEFIRQTRDGETPQEAEARLRALPEKRARKVESLRVLTEEIAQDKLQLTEAETYCRVQASILWNLYRLIQILKLDQARSDGSETKSAQEFIEYFNKFIELRIRQTVELFETIAPVSAAPTGGDLFQDLPGLKPIHVAPGVHHFYRSISAMIVHLRRTDLVALDDVALRAMLIQQAPRYIAELAALRHQSPGTFLAEMPTSPVWGNDLNLYVLAKILNINFIIHHRLDNTRSAVNSDQADAAEAHLQWSGVRYEALVPELSLIWRGKYGEPVYTPIAVAEGGSAIKAIYEKEKTKPGTTLEKRRWIGKYDGGSTVLADSVQVSVGGRHRIRTAIDSLKEFIGANFYKVFSLNQFGVVTVRLEHRAIENVYTASHALLPYVLAALRSSRLPTDQGLHSMSKFIVGYHDLEKLTECITSETPPRILNFQSCLNAKLLPERVRVEGVDVPIKGLMRMMAIARVIADIDVLGGGGMNAGFKVLQDEVGGVIGIELQKIDPGFAFSFDAAQNAFHADGPRMTDLRNIQFGSATYTNVIHWDALTPAQKNEFLETLDSVMNQLRDEAFLDYMVRRDGAFDQAGPDVWTTAEIERVKVGLRNNIQRLEAAYAAELTAYRASAPARALPNPHRFFVPVPRPHERAQVGIGAGAAAGIVGFR